MTRYAIVLFLSFFFAQANAQTLTAKTRARKVAAGSVFEVVYELLGRDVEAFRAPKFKDVKVIESGQSVEASMSNGQSTYKVLRTYKLLAPKAMTIVIPPAFAKYKGKSIHSKSLTIEVVPASRIKNSKAGEDMFIEVVVLDTPAYPGSQVVVEYIFHSALEITGMRLINEDDYNAFIYHVLQEEEPPYHSTINGKEYVSRVLREVALYPTEAGLVKVEPLMIEASYSGKSARGLLEQLFASMRSKSKMVKSPTFKIFTKRLPKPIPKNFSGATGKIQMEAFLGDTDITTDDAVSLKIVLTGTSNPTEIVAPALNLPPQLTFYDPKVVEDTIIEKDGRFEFTKTFEYLIQPQAVGTFSLSAKTSYFDKESKTYKSVKSEVMSLMVRQGKTAIVDDEENRMEGVRANFPMWLLGLLGFILVGVLVYFLRKKKVQPVIQADPIKQQKVQPKQNDVAPKVEKELDVMSKVPEKSKSFFVVDSNKTGKKYLQEVLNEAVHFFEVKLNIPHGKFNKEKLFQELLERGNDGHKIEQLQSWWTQMESAIYANMSLPFAESEALSFIRKMGEEMKF